MFFENMGITYLGPVDGSDIPTLCKVLKERYAGHKITIYPDASGNAAKIGVKIGLFQFSNAAGLTKNSSSLLLESDASGVPINEDENTDK